MMKRMQKLTRCFSKAITLTLLMAMFFGLSLNAEEPVGPPAGGIEVTPVISLVDGRVVLEVEFVSDIEFMGIESLTFDLQHPDVLSFTRGNHSFGLGFNSTVGAYIMSLNGTMQVAVDDVTSAGVARRYGLIWSAIFDIVDIDGFEIEGIVPEFVLTATNGVNTVGSFDVNVNAAVLRQIFFVFHGRDATAIMGNDADVIGATELLALRQWNATGGFAPTALHVAMRAAMPQGFHDAIAGFGRELYAQPTFGNFEFHGRDASAIMGNNPDVIGATELLALRQWNATGGFAPTALHEAMRAAMPQGFHDAIAEFGRRLYIRE